jgi:multidrug efflux pump
MQIGLVIVGGMTFGTVLTLFVLPVVYSLLARRRTVMAEPHPVERDNAAPVDGAPAVAATVAASSRGPASAH